MKTLSSNARVRCILIIDEIELDSFRLLWTLYDADRLMILVFLSDAESPRLINRVLIVRFAD